MNEELKHDKATTAAIVVIIALAAVMILAVIAVGVGAAVHFGIL